jgi:peptidoglycan/xylan/chitin deacetylase (PgdA/CDA1 family)
MHSIKLLALTLSTNAQIINPGRYPSINAVPPFNKDWTTLFTSALQPAVPDSMTCVSPTDWALTYDDGPSPETPNLLLELAKRGLKATFFVTGSSVLQYPSILKQTYEAGMEIGIHTWSHPHLMALTDDQVVAEIQWTAQIIFDVIGVTPLIFRAPV